MSRFETIISQKNVIKNCKWYHFQSHGNEGQVRVHCIVGNNISCTSKLLIWQNEIGNSVYADGGFACCSMYTQNIAKTEQEAWQYAIPNIATHLKPPLHTHTHMHTFTHQCWELPSFWRHRMVPQPLARMCQDHRH